MYAIVDAPGYCGDHTTIYRIVETRRQAWGATRARRFSAVEIDPSWGYEPGDKVLAKDLRHVNF